MVEKYDSVALAAAAHFLHQVRDDATLAAAAHFLYQAEREARCNRGTYAVHFGTAPHRGTAIQRGQILVAYDSRSYSYPCKLLALPRSVT